MVMYENDIIKGFRKARDELPELVKDGLQIDSEDIGRLLGGVKIRRKGVFLSEPVKGDITDSIFRYTIGLDLPYASNDANENWFTPELKERLKKLNGVEDVKYGPEGPRESDFGHGQESHRQYIHVLFSLNHKNLGNVANKKVRKISESGKTAEEYKNHNVKTGGQLFLSYMKEAVYEDVKGSIKMLLQIGKEEIEKRLAKK